MGVVIGVLVPHVEVPTGLAVHLWFQVVGCVQVDLQDHVGGMVV
jgi:hypothetical protein